MKINKISHEDVQTFKGSQADMVAMRKKKLPKLTQEIEKLFEDYKGGGVTILFNDFDKDGDYDGSIAMTLGVDEPENMLRLAKGLRQCAEKIEQQTAKYTNDSPLDQLLEAIDAALERRK